MKNFSGLLYSIENIFFSTFLYFYKEPIGIPLHPDVSIPLACFDAPAFIRYISEENPWWRNHFTVIYNECVKVHYGCRQVVNLLEPIREFGKLKLFLMYYSRIRMHWKI